MLRKSELPKSAQTEQRAHQARGSRSGWWFIAPYFLIFIAFGLFGLLYSFYVSFHLWFIGGEVEGLQFRGLSRYTLVFIDPDFWAALGRSLTQGLPIIFGQHLIALPLALAVHLVFAKALGRLGGLFFLPYLASSALLASTMSLWLNLFTAPINDLLSVLHNLPLIGQWIPWRLPYFSAEGMGQLWSAVGWNVLLYLMAIGAIPRSLFEAAQLDGAGFWRMLRQIVFPVVRPMVFVAFGMSLVTGLQSNAWSANYANFDTVNLPGYIYGTAFLYFNLGMANTQTWVFFMVMLLFVGMAYLLIGRNFTALETSAASESNHPLRLTPVTTVLIKLFVFAGILLSVLPIVSLFVEASKGSYYRSDQSIPPLALSHIPQYWHSALMGLSQTALAQGISANYGLLIEYLPLFWRNLWNSLYVSGLASLGTVATSALAGFAFGLLSFPYKRQLFVVVMAALVFPAMSNGIPYLIEMRILNWIDLPRSLWVPALVSALGVFLVRQFVQSTIPKSLVESAHVDGANDWLIFWRIVLPQMTPVLVTVGLLTFVTTWNHLDAAILLMRSEVTRLLPQALGLLGNGGGSTVVMGSALGMIPVLLVYALTASQLGRGLGIAGAEPRKSWSLNNFIQSLVGRWNQAWAPTGLVLDGADGVRAVACLMVVAHHLAQRLEMPRQAPWMQELQAFVMTGALGVSAFFVLSGMLLSLPFWRNFLEGKPAPDLNDFARRRFWRIAPGFYAALIITFLIARAFEPGEQMWLRLLSGLSFTSAFHYVTFFPVELNGPLWSIGFEVFCYALMPVFMLGLFALARVFPRPPSQVTERTTLRTETRSLPGGTTEITTRTVVRTRVWDGHNPGQAQPRSAALAFAYWIGVLLLTIAAHNWILYNLVPGSEGRGWQHGLIGGAKFWMPNYNPVGLFAHYCIGVLCGGWIAYRRYTKQERSLLFDVFAGVGILGLVTLLWNLRRANEYALSLGQQPYAFPIFALLVALVLGMAPFATRIQRLIDNPFNRYVARISFGLYIWHYPILELVRLFYNPQYRYFGIADFGQWLALTLLVLVLSFTAASLSYTHIEQPFLQRIARRKPASTGAQTVPARPDGPN